MTDNTSTTVLSTAAAHMLRAIRELGSFTITGADEFATVKELLAGKLVKKAWQKGGKMKVVITEAGETAYLSLYDEPELVNAEGVAIDTTEDDDGAADAEAEELIRKGEGDRVLPPVKMVVGMPEHKILPWKAHPGVSTSEEQRRAKTMALKKAHKAKNGKPEITLDEFKAAEQLKQQLAKVADDEKPVTVTEKAPKISKPKAEKPVKAEGDKLTRIKDHAQILALVTVGDVTVAADGSVSVTSTGQRISKNQFGQLLDRERIAINAEGKPEVVVKPEGK